MNAIDLAAIQQIEKELDIKLEKLDKLYWYSQGYTVDKNGQVIGLGLYHCGIRDLNSIIFLLRELDYLTLLSLVDNKINDLSSLNQLHHLTTLYLRYNQTGDLSPLLVKLRKAIHWT